MDSPVPDARSEPTVWTADALIKGFQWYLDGNCTVDPSTRICFLALGAYAGLRPSEIEGVAGERNGLNWQDIDFQRRHIHIRPEAAGKLAEPRYIAFTGRLLTGSVGERLSQSETGSDCQSETLCRDEQLLGESAVFLELVRNECPMGSTATDAAVLFENPAR